MRSNLSAGSLTQATYERIRLDILECRLRPGERLKIRRSRARRKARERTHADPEPVG